MLETTGKLIDLLREHNQLVLRLVELAEIEFKALTENNLEQLSEIVLEQDQISVQLGNLEGRRQTLERELVEHFQLKQQFTVTNVIPLLETRAAAELDEIRVVLKNNYLRLQELHRLNTLLIQQGLSYVRRMQQVLIPDRDQMYSRKGLSNQDFSQKIVDKSV